MKPSLSSAQLFFLLPLLWSCSVTAPQTNALALERLEPSQLSTVFTDLDNLDDLDRASLKEALAQSLTALRQKPATETLALGDRRVAITHIRESLTAFAALVESGENVAATLLRDFDLYRVPLPVLFTGYHEPTLHGSRVRTERFRYPIYRRPDDLVELAPAASGGGKQFGRSSNGQIVPYFSRAEIDGDGVLNGKQYELFWVDDQVSLFLLHVQGSGQVLLPNGSRVRLGYIASNGRPYTSIGKVLVDQGKLAPGEATTPAIRRYLQTHPDEQTALLFANARYIFFRVMADEGPRGSLGVPLTPGRSLAIDPRVYPIGALGLIRTKRPISGADGQVSWKAFSRFVLLQDTGAAITGRRRADIFWGADAEAEAGLMSQEGELFVVVKKR